MKKMIFALTMIATQAFAQQDYRTHVYRDVQEPYASRGIRVSFVKPMLSAEWSESWLNRRNRLRTYNENQSLDSFGISLGYAYLPVRSIGFTADMAMIEMKQSGDPAANLMRAQGNIAYAFSSMFNVKGGLNMSKFVSGDIVSNMGMSTHMQFGVGFQLTKNFGLDLMHTRMDHSGFVDGSNFESKKSGLELGFHGTF